MTCLLKRALPLIAGLAIGISLVFLFRTISSFTPLQPALSGELDKLDIPLIAPSRLTRDEMEEFINHRKVGLCHSYAPQTQVIETAPDKRITTKARILYMPTPDSWEKQPPCSSCLVILRATLDVSGKVTNIMPMSFHSYKEGVKTDAQCKREVLTAVEQIRFEPAMKDGKPVSQFVTIIYDKWGSGVEIR